MKINYSKQFCSEGAIYGNPALAALFAALGWEHQPPLGWEHQQPPGWKHHRRKHGRS